MVLKRMRSSLAALRTANSVPLMIGQFMQRHGFTDAQVNIAAVEK